MAKQNRVRLYRLPTLLGTRNERRERGRIILTFQASGGEKVDSVDELDIVSVSFQTSEARKLYSDLHRIFRDRH